MHCTLSTYPWELVELGLDKALDQIKNRMGATGLNVAFAVPPVRAWLVRGGSPLLVNTDGGFAQALPEKKLSATRIDTPIISRLKRKETMNALFCEAAQRDLAITLDISVAGVGKVAKKHPETATRNALDMRSNVSICPFNPDVAALLEAQLAHFATFEEVDGFLLCDVFAGWAEAWDQTCEGSANFSEGLRDILGTCFCESCLQRAGDAKVHAQSAREEAIRSIETVLGAGTSEPTDASGPSALTEYWSWRAEALGILLEKWSQSTSKKLSVLLRRGEPTNYQLSMTDHFPGSVRRRVVLSDKDKNLTALRNDAQVTELRFDETLLSSCETANIVRLAHEAKEAGFETIDAGAFGQIKNEAIEAIFKAFRYVRR